MAAAAAATKTTTDARTRSLELAEAGGETSCSWAAHTRDWTLDATTGALLTLALEIDSASHANMRYAFTYDATTDDARCCCTAAQAGQACWHRGLAVIKGRSMARLYTPAGRAEAARAYRANLAAEDNARVLGY